MKIINQTQASDYLKSGKTVIFPTETSYGLGCDAANQEAVDKIFKIKGRRSDKPLLVVVPTVEMAREYLEWSELLEKIAEKYWFTRRSDSEGGPGPLTIVQKNTKTQKHKNNFVDGLLFSPPSRGVRGVLANGVVSKDGTVAVRVTSAEIPKRLSSQLGRPVVATSANLADIGDMYDSAELIKMYEGREFQPDAIIDARVLPHNPPTTIVSIVNDKIEILRQGQVKIDIEY